MLRLDWMRTLPAEVTSMPEKETIERARRDAAQGKSKSTQAGESVREEMHHIREGKHGARSPKQAIAIGLSKARRAGVKLPPPKAGKTSKQTARKAARDVARGRRRRRPSARRSRAVRRALRREPRSSASRPALAAQAHRAAMRRRPSERRAAAKKAVRTKGPATRRRARAPSIPRGCAARTPTRFIVLAPSVCARDRASETRDARRASGPAGRQCAGAGRPVARARRRRAPRRWIPDASGRCARSPPASYAPAR